MPDEPPNNIDEKQEREKTPDEGNSEEEEGRSNAGEEGFRSSRTEDDRRTLEELADGE
jgi:hypothetical protein